MSLESRPARSRKTPRLIPVTFATAGGASSAAAGRAFGARYLLDNRKYSALSKLRNCASSRPARSRSMEHNLRRVRSVLLSRDRRAHLPIGPLQSDDCCFSIAHFVSVEQHSQCSSGGNRIFDSTRIATAITVLGPGLRRQFQNLTILSPVPQSDNACGFLLSALHSQLGP